MSASEGSELYMLLTSAFVASSCSVLGFASRDATREQPEHVTGAISSMHNCSFHEKLAGFYTFLLKALIARSRGAYNRLELGCARGVALVS
jgi:hypothetical protein